MRTRPQLPWVPNIFQRIALKKQSCAFILPFASREPIFVFVSDEALFALAYATPPFVFELLYDRLTTRGLENSAKIGYDPIWV